MKTPTDVREWFHYPIMIPVTADGKGPATIGKDAVKVEFAVWDQLLSSHGSFDNLPDAINHAMKLNGYDGKEPTIAQLEAELEYAKNKHLQLHGWKRTCTTPGSIWMWTRDFSDVDATQSNPAYKYERVMADTETALRMNATVEHHMLMQKMQNPTTADLAQFLDYDSEEDLIAHARANDNQIQTCAGYWFQKDDGHWDFKNDEDDDEDTPKE